MDNLVGEIEWFANGKTIEHITKRHVWMILMTGETNDIFAKNEIPFVESIFEFGVEHLEGFKSFIAAFELSTDWFGSFFEQRISNHGWFLDGMRVKVGMWIKAS